MPPLFYAQRSRYVPYGVLTQMMYCLLIFFSWCTTRVPVPRSKNPVKKKRSMKGVAHLHPNPEGKLQKHLLDVRLRSPSGRRSICVHQIAHELPRIASRRGPSDEGGFSNMEFNTGMGFKRINFFVGMVGSSDTSRKQFPSQNVCSSLAGVASRCISLVEVRVRRSDVCKMCIAERRQ